MGAYARLGRLARDVDPLEQRFERSVVNVDMTVACVRRSWQLKHTAIETLEDGHACVIEEEGLQRAATATEEDEEHSALRAS